MAMQKVGQFEVGNGSIIGPADYMTERGNARLEEILSGKNTTFNMTAHMSPSIEVAVAVNLQTDYAGWLGMRQFCTKHDIR